MKYFGASAMFTLASVIAMPSSVFAAVSPEEAEKLGNELTCVGATRAGNEEGTIPEYTGKYLGEVPGWDPEPHTGDHPENPYEDEEPILTITAENVSDYSDNLSEGQLAMFEQYPDTWKMHVYPGHRDYRYPDFVCERAMWNAKNAKLEDNGMGVDGLGHNPFPIPKNAMEVIWNHQLPFRAWTEESNRDIASVGADGDIGWGRAHAVCLAPSNDPEKKPYTSDGPSAYCSNEVLQPVRDRGNTSVNHEPYNYESGSRVAWTYNAGTRRVRLSPGYGYDQSLGGSNGNMTIDDERLFNGGPDRFNWELIGKKEMYVPANAYEVNSDEVSYNDLLTDKHVNPEFIRYELRRVWVIEATIKESSRHVYGKRRLFLDEDTWNAVVADNYDTRGNLWKHAFVNYYYHPDMSAWQAGAAFYHDLTNGEYVASNLTNERRTAHVINKGDWKPSDFTPDRLRAKGR